MPGLTTNGLPYPLPTEPVADGATAIRSLAEATDSMVSSLGARFVEEVALGPKLVEDGPQTPFGPRLAVPQSTSLLVASMMLQFGATGTSTRWGIRTVRSNGIGEFAIGGSHGEMGRPDLPCPPAGTLASLSIPFRYTPHPGETTVGLAFASRSGDVTITVHQVSLAYVGRVP